MQKASVSIVKTPAGPDFEQIYAAVKQSLDLIGGIEDIIQPGHLVLINPSWVAPPVEREAGCITLPEVARAVADIVKVAGARPVIAESSAVGVDSEKVIQSSGYRELQEMGFAAELSSDVEFRCQQLKEVVDANAGICDICKKSRIIQRADQAMDQCRFPDPHISRHQQESHIGDNSVFQCRQGFAVLFSEPEGFGARA